jgi:RecJ-like exonuclease
MNIQCNLCEGSGRSEEGEACKACNGRGVLPSGPRCDDDRQLEKE